MQAARKRLMAAPRSIAKVLAALEGAAGRDVLISLYERVLACGMNSIAGCQHANEARER